MADEPKKVWQAKNLGSGTFAISKPKRKENKKRATRIKNKRRGR